MVKNRALRLTLTALIAGLAGPWLIESARAAQAPAILPVHRIVVFKPGVPPASQMRQLASQGATVTHELGLINGVSAVFQPGQVHRAEAGLLANPDVLRVDEDFVQNWLLGETPSFQAAPLPDLRGAFPALKLSRRISETDPEIPWGIDRVNAPKAWARTRGAGVKVAVIDTGIDYKHPELAANIKGGFNATDAGKPDEFMDDNGHGTHVSGTIAAVHNSTGVVGVAPEAGLYGVKVLDAGGSGTFADVIAGIQWAADHHLDVANMSLGASRGNQALADAVAAAAKAGLAIIAAAGNSGGPVGYPAAYPEAIAISASDINNKLAWFSSRGPQVAFVAPGVEVYSTYMGGGYDTLSGTSMATPHMTGLSALAVAAKKAHGVDAIRKALKDAASPLADLKPEEQGNGLVDAAKLVR